MALSTRSQPFFSRMIQEQIRERSNKQQATFLPHREIIRTFQTRSRVLELLNFRINNRSEQNGNLPYEEVQNVTSAYFTVNAYP